MVSEQDAALIVHATTPTTGVQSLRARVTVAPGQLRFQYLLTAEFSRLRIPPLGAGRRLEELWKHTCFEAFVATAGERGYHELNFSPSRDWAAYRFTAYREGMAPAQLAVPPEIDVHCEGTRLQLDCTMAWPAHAEPPTLRVALAAVIEADDGRISYWAVRHPPGKPDFHHPDAFALELNP